MTALRVYKVKDFAKWAEKHKCSDALLLEMADEVERGLYDADLGSGLFKKRIAAQTGGKRGGYRSFLAYKSKHRIVFSFFIGEEGCGQYK